MLLDSGKIDVLTAINWHYMGLNAGYPGTNGANELAGGSPAYQRKQVQYSAVIALTRTCSLVDPLGFDVYDSPTEISWLSLWTALSGGTCKAIQPLGGLLRKFFIDPSDNGIVVTGHNYSANVTKVVFAGGNPPTNINVGQQYLVETTPTSDKITIKTLAGSSVVPGSQPGEGCYISIIKPQVISSQTKLQVPTVSWNANQ